MLAPNLRSARRTLRVAALALVIGSANGARAEIWVHPDLRITHSISGPAAHPRIGYQLAYEAKVEAGEIVPGYFLAPLQFGPNFPNLHLQVTNNLRRTLQVRWVEVEVRASRPIERPLMLVSYDPSLPGEISLLNQGWADPTDGILSVTGWAPVPTDRDKSCLEARYQRANAVIPIGRMGPRTSIKVRGLVPVHLRNERVVCAAARLDYTWGPARVGRVSFRTLVPLGPVGAMAPPPPPPAHALFLKAGKSGYTETVPVTGVISAGSGWDEFLKVWTDRTAEFDLRLTVVTTEGKRLDAGKLTVSMFVPRVSQYSRAPITISTP